MSQELETAFAMDAASIKFGFGVTGELGFEMKRLGVKKAMVLTDQSLLETTAVTTSLQSLRDEGIECAVYADVSIEPTDASFADAIGFAEQGRVRRIRGGWAAVRLWTPQRRRIFMTRTQRSFLEYVNAPIGKGDSRAGRVEAVDSGSDNGRNG